MARHPIVGKRMWIMWLTPRAAPHSKRMAHDVHTTEHVLAALMGLGIDNCLIQITGPEMPIMDGSSAQFIEIMSRPAFREQQADREYFWNRHRINIIGSRKSEMLAVPQDDTA